MTAKDLMAAMSAAIASAVTETAKLLRPDLTPSSDPFVSAVSAEQQRVSAALTPILESLGGTKAPTLTERLPVHPGGGLAPISERAHMAMNGALPKKHRPASVEELIGLLSEGIEDNGLRSSADPDDPIRQYLGTNLPFDGYHPGNPLHVWQAVLRNTIRLENGKHLYGNMQGLQEWTGTTAIAAGTPYVLPMARQVWMRLIAMRVCSVQPMSKSTGIVHYLRFLSDPGGADFSVPGQWDSEWAQHISEQQPIREVKLQIDSAPLNMDTKKLRAEWSSEANLTIQADFGLSIQSETLAFLADEIAREVNALLLTDLRTGMDPTMAVTAGNINYGTALPAAGYPSMKDWNSELYTAMLRADALVRATRRARCNIAIAGQDALIRLMRLNNWVTLTGDPAANDWNVGINLVGSVQGSPTFEVLGADPDVWPTEVIAMIHKGEQPWDAPEIYAPWIPIYLSGVHIASETFCESQACLSRFGYLKSQAGCVGTVTVLPGVQGVAF